MARHGKKYENAAKRVEPREYEIVEALGLLKTIAFAKFDETLELSLRLGVNPKYADQMVRGTVVLPNGLGKTKKVAVITSAASFSLTIGRMLASGSTTIRPYRRWTMCRVV